MLVVINNEVFNMDRFDTVRPTDAAGHYKDRISFFRGSEEAEYAAFDTKAARDAVWKTITNSIEDWYS